MSPDALPDWPRALGEAPAPGSFRATPEAFVVIESFGFSPQGDGEHLWFWIEKRGVDTRRAVSLLSRIMGVSEAAIGYSGLKDRHAVTRQWLSAPLRETPDPGQLEALASEGVKVLEVHRHPRKLKRGSHRLNRFVLEIGFAESDREAVEARWQALVETGAPNYFGAQRFGHGGANLPRARALLARGWRKRDDRGGLLLSTARSYLFNRTLAARVAAGLWNVALPGEVLNLDGSGSLFLATAEDDAALAARLGAFDVHPTAPLWGRGRLGSEGEAAAFERAQVADEAILIEGLERAGVELARRALRVRLIEPGWTPIDGGARLDFSLVRGAYATAVLRELITAPML
ncbi:tRNA pseudouridine(13) synthase TruD [Halotalea alkalilenta]|uniref:tRNA pseudouridine(13) synthase TruD n=1 Tax=Halotalea alkalilenta TaxID=376489 RepID=UPI000AA73CF8|nr:tRNA pseudouridine(13) synthase TruD [Halotalea alkalilenta]